MPKRTCDLGLAGALIWVPVEKGIDGMGREGKSLGETIYIGLHPALDISKCIAENVIKGQIHVERKMYWETAPANKHGQLFIGNWSINKAKELLSTSINQFKIITWLLTGHAVMRRQYHNMFCGWKLKQYCISFGITRLLLDEGEPVLGTPFAEPDSFSVQACTFYVLKRARRIRLAASVGLANKPLTHFSAGKFAWRYK